MKKPKYLEYFALTSVDELPQLQMRSDFIASFKIPHYLDPPPPSPPSIICIDTNERFKDQANSLGMLSARVQRMFGIESFEKAPKYIYILHSLSEQDKFAFSLQGINLRRSLFRFHPIQEDRLSDIEKCNEHIFLFPVAFNVFNSYEGHEKLEIGKKIQDNFFEIKNILMSHLEELLPARYHSYFAQLDDEVSSCLFRQKFDVIRDGIAFLRDILFSHEGLKS